jgi:hypothetical protein
MSSIVSFFTLTASKLEQLIIASKIEIVETQSGILFFKRTTEERIDNFGSFLATDATPLKAYDYSGYTFLTLQDILEERGLDFYDAEINDASAIFRENRQDSSFIISSESATELLIKLKEISISDTEIEANYLSYYEEPIPEGGVEAVRSAFEILKVWLGSVEVNQIGLFLFG